jgi:HEAT repeat protein
MGKKAASAEPALLPLLRDEEPALREVAIEVLGKIGEVSDQTIARIASLLDDKHEGVRVKAINALGQFGPRSKPWAPALLRIMQDRNEKRIRVRFYAATALGRIGRTPPEVVPFLADCLKGADALLRPWAAATLLELGSAARPALPAMIAVLTAPPPPPPEDTPEYHYINDLAHWRTRLTLLEAIAQFDPPAVSALPELQRLAREDKDKEIREAAQKVVQIIKEPAKKP